MSLSLKYDFEIIVGTYEEFILGYQCCVKTKTTKQSFASHDHTSSIRSLACSGRYLASGASDDRIIIYDLLTRKECNMLVHHNSTVTCLQFTNRESHLMSGSTDGVLAITNVANWQVEKMWNKAHKEAAILDIAIHTSGKLALTLGSDMTLRTWNLIKGRQAYTINLKTKSKDAKSLEKIVWGPDGIYFILYGGKYVEIWDIENGDISNCIEFNSRVTSGLWLNANKLLIGLESGQLATVKARDSTKLKYIEAHSSRVKSLAKYNEWIVSISSDGRFKIWTEKLEELLEENVGCRPTCLCVVSMVKIEKQEAVEEVEEEEENSD